MKTYRVNEIFYSLQGEGHHAGRAALFVRFSGCNLRCPFCDTSFDSYQEMSAPQIAEALGRLTDRCKFVVLTGGEPSLQVDAELIALLHAQGYFLAMETNGTHPIAEGVDWVTCSPKTPFVRNARLAIEACDELKLVYDGNISPTDLGLQTKHHYLQPCDTGDPERNRSIMAKLVEYVKEHPQWGISLQQHKIMDIR